MNTGSKHVAAPFRLKKFSPTRHYCKHSNNSDYWQERGDLFHGILSFIFLRRLQENRQSQPLENAMIDPKQKLLTLRSGLLFEFGKARIIHRHLMRLHCQCL
ncbi:hypothetical protein Zmor_001317 [Zophobas morio]|uniref:Uncharacterized protein n=1 Tax=Zophobas morio TaxID=2755281 RepID=A0AA38IYS5_9CUCU|nr:hypothetical protein Zmor_001317 [Zophobas morio]